MKMVQKPKLAIIGGGWLGKPLALHLQGQQYPLTVSCSRAQSAAQLSQLGLDAVAATLSTQAQGDWQQLLQDKDIAICLLPPRRGNHSDSSLTQQLTVLLAQLNRYQVTKLILISSTGIYQKNNQPLTESSPLDPHSSMWPVEQLLRSQADIEYTILRCAGLISQDRNPTTSLARKAAQGYIFSAGKSPINLLHRDDAIAIIEQVIRQQCWGETLNACADCHPSRSEFYQYQAQQLGLLVPQFTTEASQPQCYVDNSHLKQCLNYRFQRNCASELTA